MIEERPVHGGFFLGDLFLMRIATYSILRVPLALCSLLVLIYVGEWVGM